MEVLATLLPFVPQAAIPLVICVCFYINIQSKRKETKTERDKDSQDLHDKILKHEFQISRLKDDLVQQKNINDDLTKQIIELSKAVSSFATSVDNLKEIVNELKADIKEMRK